MNLASIGPAVALIQSERLEAERKGGKAWQPPGIRKALTDCDGPLPDVMRAALIAALDPTLDAPSAEAFRLRWQRPPAPAPTPRGVPCPSHKGQLEPCRVCRTIADANALDADGIAAAAAAARAAIRPTHTPGKATP